jgi:hypothetical protein
MRLIHLPVLSLCVMLSSKSASDLSESGHEASSKGDRYLPVISRAGIGNRVPGARDLLLTVS